MDSEEDTDWDEFVDEPDDDTPTQPDPERDKLEHQIKSAEGRYRKSEERLNEFQQSIQSMQDRLAQMDLDSQENPETEPEPENIVPEGWSREEWQDYKDDQPVTAELYENQTREVQKVRDELDDYRRQDEVKSFRQEFRNTVLDAHPDFDDLLEKEKDDINKFINDQDNPIVRDAYYRIYNEGSAEEVVQLLSDYKSARPEGGQQSTGSKVDEALAVTGKSSRPNVSYQGRRDPDDFDSAWDEFADLDD